MVDQGELISIGGCAIGSFGFLGIPGPCKGCPGEIHRKVLV